MGLIQLTDRVYYYPHQPQFDRPMLAYIKGSRLSMAVDAGYSAGHVDDFYCSLIEHGLKVPDLTAITHWHYDHTFGMHHINGWSIAHRITNEFLEREKEKFCNSGYIDVLRREDSFFAEEYKDGRKLTVGLPDFQFETELTINLGGLTARLFHAVSPHSEDTVCIHVPEERLLFLGDATSEDFFNNGYMDKEKLRTLIGTIREIDCKYCILSHTEPLEKQELLDYLDTVL